VGAHVTELRRLGKRIAIGFDHQLFLIFHLMIAGRLQLRDRNGGASVRNVLARFEFEQGTLMLTEAGSKKRAAIHVVRGIEGLRQFERGALEILGTGGTEFAAVLRSENHTLKRSLTDPRLFSGIGNAYSDEILHRAQLSPLALTSKLSDHDIAKLFESCRAILSEWTDRLRVQNGESFPSKVTAFRPEMAVHGRFGKPCPVCGSPVQRIVYAENQCNYCATCQTGGRLLADRAMSRLLKYDWPRSLDEMEKHFEGRR
jgi:formamidopyrimidine-DNA glycosylase